MAVDYARLKDKYKPAEADHSTAGSLYTQSKNPCRLGYDRFAVASVADVVRCSDSSRGIFSAAFRTAFRAACRTTPRATFRSSFYYVQPAHQTFHCPALNQRRIDGWALCFI